jgi:hypothetical protein
MNARIALGTLALLTAVSFAYGADPNFEGVEGKWELDFPKSDWHYIEITGETKEGGPFWWNNKAGKRWLVESEYIQAPNNGPRTYILSFGDKSPYPGHTLELVRDSDGKLVFLREHKKNAKEAFQTWVRR